MARLAFVWVVVFGLLSIILGLWGIWMDTFVQGFYLPYPVPGVVASVLVLMAGFMLVCVGIKMRKEWKRWHKQPA